MRVSIDLLQPTEINLVDASVERVEKNLRDFGVESLSWIRIYPWGKRYLITDGNTRAYIAYKEGITELDAIYRDPSSASPNQHKINEELAIIATRNGINHVRDLEGRIVSAEEAEKLYEEASKRAFR